MIQIIEGAPEGVLAFAAVGEVDADDYAEVLRPAIDDWQRCALVTDEDWVRHSAKALGWLMGGRLRVFDLDELKAALEWAAADD